MRFPRSLMEGLEATRAIRHPPQVGRIQERPLSVCGASTPSSLYRRCTPRPDELVSWALARSRRGLVVDRSAGSEKIANPLCKGLNPKRNFGHAVRTTSLMKKGLRLVEVEPQARLALSERCP